MRQRGEDTRGVTVEDVLVVPRRLSVEAESASWAVVFDSETGRRLKLTRRVQELMRGFVTPRPVYEVAGRTPGTKVLGALEQLIAHGFLVLQRDADAARRESMLLEVQTVSPTMFRAPSTRAQPAGQIRFVGVPYDGGSVVKGGSRLGPEVIRRRSCDQEYRVGLATGQPLGWFEVDTRERLLEGTTISDEGNIRVGYGEDPAALWQRLRKVTAGILESGDVPFILGGDHSVSFAPIEAVQQRRPCAVIWCDAHTDSGELPRSGAHNHKNVLRRIIALPNVVTAVVVGHRGYTTSDKVSRPPSKTSVVSAAEVRRHGPAAVLEKIPAGLDCYVSIDIDVLDPAQAPATATPAPDGLLPHQLKAVVREIGRQHAIVAGDFVELNPAIDSGPLSALQAVQVITVCLAAAATSRARDVELARFAVQGGAA